MIACAMYADVHHNLAYNGKPAPDFNGEGWYWLAKSKDDTFKAQGFVRMTNDRRASTLSHFAFQFGDQKLFMDRSVRSNRWIWDYYWNGEKKLAEDTPMTIDGTYWVNQAAGLKRTGSENIQGLAWSVGRHDAERFSCFEYGDVAVFTSFMDWQPPSAGPWGAAGAIELEGNIDFLDPSFGSCASQGRTQGQAGVKVDPKDILVTIEQNDKVCKDNLLSKHQCEDPDPPPDPPTKEQLCEQNNVEMSHAEDLCADQQHHGDAIYQNCLFDVCASIDKDAQLNAVGGAELEAAMLNPEAECAIKTADLCLPCDICSSYTTVDLTNIVQNNLGGQGPDSGAEEIRYKNAIDLTGRKLDVVLTAESAYTSPRPQKNGNSPAGFGKVIMKTKSETNFKFSFQDAETGEAVGVKDIALTFYDLDQARKTQQRETISVCGAEEIYTSSDTELAHDASGRCHSYTSTVRGTGKDNPQNPGELTKTQAARSVTFEFHSKASISFTAAVSGSGKTPRPILFSFKPQVACGASDAQSRCAE